MSKLSVRIERFTPRRSHSLFGVIDLVIPEPRLSIKDATVHQSHGQRGIGLPGVARVRSRLAART